MSYWERVRREVRERITTGDVSRDLYETILSTGISGLAVIQPTFYLGRFYILCFDYMDFVEKLLSGTSEPNDVLRHILYLRETASTMGRCIRNAAEPVDGMINFLDPIYDKMYASEELECECGCGCTDCKHEHEGGEDCDCQDMAEDLEEDLDDEFILECRDLSADLKAKLLASHISERVAEELSQRMSQTYSGCVTFVRELRGLHNTEQKPDVSAIMVSLIDIQYIVDTKLRRLLLEDVLMGEHPSFTTGLMPWISHAVEELSRMMKE